MSNEFESITIIIPSELKAELRKEAKNLTKYVNRILQNRHLILDKEKELHDTINVTLDGKNFQEKSKRLARKMKTKIHPSTPLSELVPVHVSSVFRTLGVETPEQAARLTREEILQLDNIGPNGLMKLDGVLKALDMSFKEINENV